MRSARRDALCTPRGAPHSRPVSTAAALRSTSEPQRLRASKSASREFFRNRTASRGRSAAYRFGASREFAYAYEKPRQERQSLQTDPIGYSDNLNLYAYAGNEPIANSDPTGLEVQTDQWNLNLGFVTISWGGYDASARDVPLEVNALAGDIGNTVERGEFTAFSINLGFSVGLDHENTSCLGCGPEDG